MIVDSKMENQDWLKSFRSKLWKILTTAPIYIDMTLTPRELILTLPIEDQSKTFILNFDKAIQANLFDIKTWIVLNWCPRLEKIIRTERLPTPDEILLNIENKEEDPYKKVITEETQVTYIEKITPKTSIVIVTNGDLTTEKTIFKMNYPIVKFLKVTRTYSAEDRRNFFMSKSTFLYISKLKGEDK